MDTRDPVNILAILPKRKPKEVMRSDWLLIRAIEEAISGFYNFDCKEIEDAKNDDPIIIDPNLTFFGKHILTAGLIGHYILYGQANEAMRLIDASVVTRPPESATAQTISITPSTTSAFSPFTSTKTAKSKQPIATTAEILTVIIEARDPLNRRVEGTLLGIAGMAHSFNPLVALEEPHGIVERIKGSGYITPEDATTTLNKTFPVGWIEQNHVRMARFIYAYTELAEKIIANKVPVKKKSRERCAAVQAFRKAIATDEKEVIRRGLTFNIIVAVICIKFLIDNKNRFGGLNTYKSHLFLIIAFGSLLRLATADDAQIVSCGVHNVSKNKRLPLRDLTTLRDGSLFYSPQSTGLGFTLFLDENGNINNGLPPWPTDSNMEKILLEQASLLQNLTLLKRDKILQHAKQPNKSAGNAMPITQDTAIAHRKKF